MKVILIWLFLIRYVYWSQLGNDEKEYVHRCGLDGHDCDQLTFIGTRRENGFDIGKLTKI